MLSEFKGKLKGSKREKSTEERLPRNEGPVSLFDDEEIAKIKGHTIEEAQPEKINNEKAKKELDKKRAAAKDWQEYGFSLTEEAELANKSSSDDDDWDIWNQKFEAKENKVLTSEAKKFNVNERDAKDATTGKNENTYNLHDPRNELSKRRRLENRQQIQRGNNQGFSGKTI